MLALMVIDLMKRPPAKPAGWALTSAARAAWAFSVS